MNFFLLFPKDTTITTYPAKFHKVRYSEGKHIETLSLARGDRNVISQKPLAQMQNKMGNALIST